MVCECGHNEAAHAVNEYNDGACVATDAQGAVCYCDEYRADASRSHECGACGGSGEEIETAFPYDAPILNHHSGFPCPVCLGSGRISDVIPDAHTCDACEGYGEIHRIDIPALMVPWSTAETIQCYVCKGVGRLSDRMPARDAIADAQTLAYFATTPRATRGVRRELDLALNEAAYETHRAVKHGEPFYRLIGRAAFRAVPGLRG